MSEQHPLSGTLGTTQLMLFASASAGEVVNPVAEALGLTARHVVVGDVVSATAYLAQEASPEMLIVEVNDADAAPQQLDALANHVNPHTRVLVTGRIDSIRFYQWLNDLGIDGYLLQPFTADELKQLLAKGAKTQPHKDHALGDQSQQIVAVIGARGGVGTTMIAANLASIFAREHRRMTALVDLDPYFGCAALAFNLEPSRGLRDALEKPDRVDSLFLERVMIKPFTNLSVLGAEEPLMDPIVTHEQAGEIMVAALKEKFTSMVVDLPRQMNPLTRHMLTVADRVVIVAESQLNSLRDSLRLKDYLVDHAKRPAPLLVLNRIGMSSANEISSSEFAKHFGQTAVAECAFVEEIIAATANGEMLSEGKKADAVITSIRQLAQQLLGSEEAPQNSDVSEAATTKSSLLARLMGRK